MTVIVRDDGFHTDDWRFGFADIGNLQANPGLLGVDLSSDTNIADLTSLPTRIAMIRIDFPDFADGRGFTIARHLRQLGYRQRLRAKGHLIADQYAMARRAGFDEVEISDDLAARQTQGQWLARSNWQDHDYQSRLRRAL